MTTISSKQISRIATQEQLQRPVLTQEAFEKIAVGWDECKYDMVPDIGAALRLDFERLACSASAADAGSLFLTQEGLEEIAEGWDGCMYDSVGETIDVGDALRLDFRRLATPVASGPARTEDDALIIAAVTNANVNCVHPTADTTLDIGRAVLAAYRKELASKAGQAGSYDATVKLLRQVVDLQHTRIVALESVLAGAGAGEEGVTKPIPAAAGQITPPADYVLVPQELSRKLLDEIASKSFDLDDAAREIVKGYWSRALGFLSLYAPQAPAPKGYQMVPRELPQQVVDAITATSEDSDDTTRELIKDDWSTALQMIELHAPAPADAIPNAEQDERALFEVWTVDGGWPVECTFNLARRGAGRYIEGSTELCWLAWQFRGGLGSIHPTEERAVFEAWTKNGGNRLTHVFSLVRVDGGRYLETDSELCWLAWQGRAALMPRPTHR